MLICVTNRLLCKDNFFNRINEIAKGKPDAIILREKDLFISEYEKLAVKVKEICEKHQIQLIINQNIDIAAKLNLSCIHLSISDLRKYQDKIGQFAQLGVSVHSVAEAAEAQELGASYLIAGHIFPTDCKKDLPPRGLSFLQEVCDSVRIPVFAIGGITKERVKDVTNAGAKGICVMSQAMTCPNPVELMNSLLARLRCLHANRH
ncbi:MAG: thiamine phosphate synthase [Dehalobacterium sp.]